MSPISRRALLQSLAGGALLAASPKLKITKFETHKVLLGPRRDLLFLEIHTDGGIVGLGEGSLPERVEIVEQALKWLEPRLVGLDPGAVEGHWDRMYYRLSRWRDGSVLMTALAAVDIALWDIEAKRLGVPVWRLLGGPIHSKLRVYYSHWDSSVKARTPAAFAERAVQSREQGWTAVKWIVQKGNTEAERIEQAVGEVEAVRKAGGKSFDICLELWETFTPRSAIEFARAVAPYHPMFIEEPTQRENPYAFTEIAAKSPVPVATGEGLLTRFDFRHLLEAKGAAIIQPDVIHCGGITELRKIANLAEVYGVEVAPHQWYGPIAHVASLAAMSVCRNFLIQEWDAARDKVYQEVTSGLYPVQNGGVVQLPEGPGLGISVDFAELRRRFPYRV
ncbi:MAG: mandelate racemase/muconate lactonizing enzyme family protein [Acidobacteria bacterium]|nr:mandelate racemase/muconate lactonizing enzyme family protein [Acidobacteriota bacterium]